MPLRRLEYLIPSMRVEVTSPKQTFQTSPSSQKATLSAQGWPRAADDS